MPSALPKSHRAADDAEREQQRRAAERAENGDDPPPPIPEGYKQIEWHNGDVLTHFMLWTQMGDEQQPQWHQGKVVKTLAANVRGGWTHDAIFVGFDGKRGAQG